jgi:hypothetical protein
VNCFKYPLTFSLLVGIEVWDHGHSDNRTVLDNALGLVCADGVIAGYMVDSDTEWLNAKTTERFLAAVDLVLNHGVAV